ncbi:Gfo/Idh/MocA family protein [Streptomyces sp. NPDC096132]|uniref:Gfo/Idh/MocA family protein n=1 Tax=Streptomyces sp. NPDC096132 TaxID=3366075 RepID=UPI003823182A
MTSPQSLAVGLVGAGRMGSFQAETLARRLPGVRLAAVADPTPGAAQTLAERLECPKAYTEIGEPLAAPEIEAVVIVTPARTHAGLIRRFDPGFRAAHEKITSVTSAPRSCCAP